MQPKDVHVTPEGLAEIRKELDQLVNQRRPEIVQKIKTAREFGDLSENFEYHAAKNEQGFIESRIAELEAIIRNHVLIEEPPHTDQVQTGSTVSFEEDGSVQTYKIVGPAEADYTAGKISFESELGRALLGLKVGQEAEVKTATGSSYTVRVTSIE